MNFRNISAWCIRNPIVPIVLFVGLILAGIISFSRMQIQNDPDIEFPVVRVLIAQPGAAPTEIEKQITQKVEAAVRSINGIESIGSTASEGMSGTGIQFQIGVDINEAVNEVKNAVDQARGDMPDGILEPQVIKVQGSSFPIAYYAIQADDMTMEQLSWFVDDTVAKRLQAIPGMAAVQRGGGVDREIMVTLDPGRMQSLGVTASQVNLALRGLNLNAAGGKAEIGGSRQSVRVLGNAADAYALSQAEISLGGGRFIKLSDIAVVKDGYKEISSISKNDGKPVVTFSIARARGASDVSVSDQVTEEIVKIEKENPGLHVSTLFTSVDFTKQQYESSISTMIEGAILAVVVVFFFLRDWRATVISAIAIPLSAIPTFWFLNVWFGFTLNMMSLLALGLVAGVLVDDAIVEIENIVRHMRMGKSAYQASIDAADEIGLAVVATTLSIAAVFLPVGFMPGVPGQFFKNFGFTVVVAVLLSLAVARMITPMIAAYFLKAHGQEEHGSGPWMDRYLNLLRWTLDKTKAEADRGRLPHARARLVYHAPALVLAAIGAVASQVMPLIQARSAGKDVPDFSVGMMIFSFIGLYLALALLTFLIGMIWGKLRGWQSSGWAARTRWVMTYFRDHRVWMLGVGLAALVMTGVMFGSMPMQFFPQVNSDFGEVSIEMVPGTTLAQTEAVADRVTQIVLSDSEVAIAPESIREGSASLFITYAKDRKSTSQEIERRLTPKLLEIPDARISFVEQGGGPPSSGPNRPVVVMLTGSNPDTLDAAANTLAEQMRGMKELVAPRVSADMRRPEVVVKPRLDLAASMGVSTAALSQAIRIATIGEIDQNAAKFSLSDRQVPIRVRLSEDSRRDLSTLQNLPVPTGTGGSVPLSSVAEISLGSGPVSIQRYNQQRRTYISADLAPGIYQGEAMKKVNELPLMKNLPNGVSNEAAGQSKFLAELLTSFAIAVVSGILLVFAVLVLLYHRLISPLVNMGSLFLAPLGGLIAVFLIGQPISLPVFIGILMLFGIVAKNSILLIDFAIDEMAKGADKYTAIVEAGHKRAQPIIMTTVAMTAGMIPTAVSLTGDGAWRAPMGTVVIGGLILSTALTLLIVPAGFSLADGVEKRLGPKLRRMFLSHDPTEAKRDRDRDLGIEGLPAE
ncbi:efflux RND transporter permease subunit [Novosphingobium sp. B 225]|uniref:efflux RND transporter permease subunit n=1 Tax=Novosphingobium sp. B 225 TaxID=1961849 RepID=UPI000B4B8A1A|nr:efflux RND transporter permease subunit [Novosphingobium sp. B 225]